MFEGLTSEILDKAIFKGLNLKIIQNSFIYNDSGQISDEMDCMIVVGEGKEIAFTKQQFRYHISNVIAVIQVKKNLFAKDINDAYLNLRSVMKIAEPRETEKFVYHLHRDAYKTLTSKEIPTKDRRKRFTEREDFVYHTLMMEAFYPLRIVFGYFGFKNEYSLREGFVRKMEELTKNGPIQGYSPGSFPNLIICGENSIIKNNGMPIGFPFTNDVFFWHLLFTTYEKPIYYLLELIWTRLSYKFEISSEIFGDDFDLDEVHPFISCKEKQVNKNQWAWEYNYHALSKLDLEKPLIKEEWKPTEIDKNEFIILNVLLKKGEIHFENDIDFKDFIKDNQINQVSFLDGLVKKRLIFVDEKKIRFLVDTLVCVFTPEGKHYAGENKNGEMTNYFSKQYK